MSESVQQYAVQRLANPTVGPALPEAGSATSTAPIIGTHDGSFHCDEALACGMLRHTQGYDGSVIVRTRVPDVLAKCNIVVDVGATYDPSMQRYDHHQKEFQDTMDTGVKKYNTRLSSAGLVYKHFGLELIRAYCANCVDNGRLKEPVSEADLLLLYDRVYSTFIEHIDGIDNGVEEFKAATEGEAVVRNYTVGTTLSSRVGRLYPRWNEDQSRAKEDSAFVAAMKMATTEFFENVDLNVCSWLPARNVVQAAFDGANKIHESGALIVLQEGGCPWKDHIVSIEKAAGVEGRTLYVLYPDQKNNWRVQCVNKANSSFANRKDLPWKGLRDEALVEASGIQGGIFVHVGGFIGGNKTYEGALAMAVHALSA